MIENWIELDDYQDTQGRFPLNDYHLALFQEVSELVDSASWKPWKGTIPDRENAKREIVDCLFFLHHIARNWQITPEELNAKYKEVMKNNIRRYCLGTGVKIPESLKSYLE